MVPVLSSIALLCGQPVQGRKPPHPLCLIPACWGHLRGAPAKPSKNIAGRRVFSGSSSGSHRIPVTSCLPNAQGLLLRLGWARPGQGMHLTPTSRRFSPSSPSSSTPWPYERARPSASTFRRLHRMTPAL